MAETPDEGARYPSPLELFFDLTFVVAVAFAATELHHALVEGHVAHAVVGYVIVFFGIWWAWANFTWFASAYDTDEVPYRVLTLVQMGGVLVLVAGIPAAFAHCGWPSWLSSATTRRGPPTSAPGAVLLEVLRPTRDRLVEDPRPDRGRGDGRPGRPAAADPHSVDRDVLSLLGKLNQTARPAGGRQRPAAPSRVCRASAGSAPRRRRARHRRPAAASRPRPRYGATRARA